MAPRRSRAVLRASATPESAITPDVEGTYDLVVTTPYDDGMGGALQCPVAVLADPQDPLCPGYALAEPTVVALPDPSWQLALAPEWSTPRINSDRGQTTGMVASDLPADDVAGLAAPFTSVDPIAETGIRWENAIAQSVGAVPILVGRTGMNADGVPLRRSSFRVVSLSTTAAVLRDRVARSVLGLNPGTSAPGFTGATSFVLEVTTLLSNRNRGVLLVAAAPEARFDDGRTNTATRLQDFTNGTAVAANDRELDVTCRRIEARRNTTADFLWLVDTSRSMDDDQERLGNTAERFFREMTNAGIDFRVGVIQAGSHRDGPDLDDPGFAWIAGSDPNGARRLAYEATYQRFREERPDTFQPYPLEGGEEEPIAAAVLTHGAMERRAMEPTDRRRFRANATRVAFFVTDEAGTNDDARYFALDRARWGALREDRVRAVTRWFADNRYLTFAMANVFVRQPCPSLENFVTCVAVGNGGAYIPLNTATDAEVAPALSRIVDAVAGASSEFVLDRVPVSSSLRVRVEETLVPRSRASGFDYDDSARSLVFRGAMFRPRVGQSVRAAYFYWRPRTP